MNTPRRPAAVVAACLAVLQSWVPSTYAQVTDMPFDPTRIALPHAAFAAGTLAAARLESPTSGVPLFASGAFELSSALTLASASLAPLGAVPPALSPLTMERLATFGEEGREGPGMTHSTPRRQTWSGVADASRSVHAALRAAGSVSDLSPSNAYELGERLHRFLHGDAEGASSPPPDGTPPGALERELMLRALSQVYETFTGHYAPEEFKRSGRGVDFRKEYRKAVRRVRAMDVAAPPIDRLHAFQSILADFVASAQDYHAAIVFHSTEYATLPFMVLGLGDAYHLAYIDRTAPGMSREEFPFEPGDELVEFGGKPAAQAVRELVPVRNSPETDDYLASVRLTSRTRRLGMMVPQGKVTIKVRGRDGDVREATLPWRYESELPRSPILHGRSAAYAPAAVRLHADPIERAAALLRPKDAALTRARELLRRFVPRTWAHPLWRLFGEEARDSMDNRFLLGSKQSYVRMPGPVIWQLPPLTAAQVPFVLRIHKAPDGRRLGYIRLPDYMAGGDAQGSLSVLAAAVRKFESETDALVIDQVGNGGGDMFFMNAFAEFFLAEAFDIQKHRIILEGEDAELAKTILKEAEDAAMREALESAILELFGSASSGRSPGIAGIVQYAKDVLREIAAGRQPSRPLHLFGVRRLEPHPEVRYSKPILLIVSPANFSAADFFASYMKRSGRATLLGVGPKSSERMIRTAGAGGAVKETSLLSAFYVRLIAYTWTLAVGPRLENAGVEADIAYWMSPKDLRDGFQGLADMIAAWAKKLDRKQ